MKKKHLLIIWLNGIGDLVMAMPALSQFQKKHKFTEITILSRSKIKELFKNTHYFKDVEINQILTNKEKTHYDLNVIFKLLKLKVDVGITIFPSQGISSALLLKLSGAKKRYQHEYRFKWFKNIKFGINKPSKIINNIHISGQMNMLINETTKLDLNLKNIINLPKLIKRDLGIHCTASKYKSHRNWRNRKWKSVINFYLNNNSGNVHIFWGSSDSSEMNAFKKLIQSERIIHHYNLKITELLNELNQLKLFIGIDSGIGHLAAMTDIDQIVLYGPFNEIYSQPLNHKAVILRPRGSVSNFIPYKDTFDEQLPNIADLDEEDVIEAIKKRL